MTLRETDEALEAWNQRLSAAAQNLLDLQSEPVYQQIAGSSGIPKAALSGATAARVEAALGATSNVYQHFGLLNETIQRAHALRANLPAIFGAEQRLQEIEQLLRGKSIHLPPVEVPLEQRTLLSGVSNIDRISPDDLLEAMTGAFEAARDAVFAVDRAWRNLGKELSAASTLIANLRQRSASVRCEATPQLDEAEQLLRTVRAQVQSDPLGAAAGLTAQIDPLLAPIEAAVAARERLDREIADGLAAAHRQMDQLASLHADAVAACAEAHAKIADCAALPHPAEATKVDGLRQWLGRLDKKRAEGVWEPLHIGLRQWNTAAGECVAEEREALAANRAVVETRNELRGRLDALKAKARARGRAEDQGLVKLAQSAEALLYTRPTALDQAADAVTSYERQLNGRPTTGGTKS